MIRPPRDRDRHDDRLPTKMRYVKRGKDPAGGNLSESIQGWRYLPTSHLQFIARPRAGNPSGTVSDMELLSAGDPEQWRCLNCKHTFDVPAGKRVDKFSKHRDRHCLHPDSRPQQQLRV